MKFRDRLILFVAIAFVYILSIFGLHLPQNNLSKLFEKASPAVVWIGTDEWQGTGFLINSDGLIATAGHVADAWDFNIEFSDGRRGRAKYVYMESPETCDVGFIQITSIERDDLHILEWLNLKVWIDILWNNCVPPEPIKGLPYLKFDTKVKIGEQLAIIGYPWGYQKGLTLTQGIVAALDRDISFFGEKLLIHTDSASWPGNSGSPVIDMDGEVVGILVGGRYGCDNYSLITRAKIVELALEKYKAKEAMEKCR